MNVAAPDFGGITTSVVLTELDALSVSPGTKNERSKATPRVFNKF